MASEGKEGSGVSEQRIDCEFKVVLIGDYEVVKSQILAHSEREGSKTGKAVTVKYESQILHIEKKSVKAHIWGIIHQEQYNVDSNANYKDADGVILVYDITNHKSFDCMTRCQEELRRIAKKRQAIILIGNKSGSKKNRKVLREEACGFAEKNDLIFQEMSALEGTNFDNALKDLLTKLVNINSNNTATNTTTDTTTKDNTTNTTTDTTTKDNTTNTTTKDNPTNTTTINCNTNITINVNTLILSALEGTNFDNALKDLLTKLVNIISNNTATNTTTDTTTKDNTTNTTTKDNTTTDTTTKDNLTNTTTKDNTTNTTTKDNTTNTTTDTTTTGNTTNTTTKDNPTNTTTINCNTNITINVNTLIL